MDYSLVKPFPPLVGAPTSVMTWAGGLIVEGALEDAQGALIEDLSTDARWKVQVDAAYRFHNKNGTFGGFVGLFEQMKALHEPEDWTAREFDDASWEDAFAIYAGYYFGHQKNCVNHYGLLPRMIPMLEEGKPERFARAFLPGGAAPAAEVMAFVEARSPLRVAPNSELTIILDVGCEATAYPALRLSGGRGAEIRLLYAEALRLSYEVTDAEILGQPDGGTERISGEAGQETSGWTFDSRGAIDGFYDLYEPAGRTKETYEPFAWRTFRFLELRVKTAEEPIDLISLTYRFTAYPFQRQATFHCSDPQYEKMYDISWRTFRLCAHETFEDCPYYEQLQYAGDAQLTSLIAMRAAGDDRLTRQALTHFDWSRLPEGLTQCRYPSRFMTNIPSWSLHWIFMVADFLMHSGDREFAGRFLPGIANVLGWFRRRKNEDGLLSALPYFNATSWTLGWWRACCPGSEDGPTTVINAQYVQALECAALIAREADDPASAARLEAEAADVRRAINRVLWSEAEGLYYDRPGGPELSVYCNAWALVAGVPDEARIERMLQRFPSDPTLAEVDFFGQFFVFRALSAVGRYDVATELLGAWHRMANVNGG